MKLSIRMKIFLPVMGLLIAFPVAVWMILAYSLEGSMNYNAKRDLELLIRRTGEAVARWEAGSSKTDGAEEEGLLSELRGLVQTAAGETKMLALNGGYRVVYPRNYDDQPEMTQLYALALSELTQPDTCWEADGTVEETIGENRYLLYYRYLEAGDKERVSHVILYCPIHDTGVILDRVSGLVLMIMGIMAAVWIVLFWFVAGSISGPVRRLCEAARGIGEKKFRPVETGATVKELCELEDEINQMQEKLLRADQAERAFFQNASHELRTPLMSIGGYAQGIQRGVFADTSQAAGVILEESNRLTEVVDGILTLTRMDQLRYQVVPVRVELRAFIEERFERLEGLAYSKKIKLFLEPGEEFLLITDVQLLERAVTNVVSNCIRYAKTAVHITVESSGGQILLTVQDDGPGLGDEDLLHLFERFYKGKNGNHGLGLAIAKRSLEYMGGDIEAQSRPDGAVFIIRLPQDCRSFAMEE
ncbi:MAG: HAMP domain-containing histidine kinase [Lachnospiraceae bacterium]|nr:HAMP domain-containing histidine kinase [Lachnospiraceae bacterium]